MLKLSTRYATGEHEAKVLNLLAMNPKRMEAEL